jgi:hypothetical protein
MAGTTGARRVRSTTIVGRRTRGYTINVYRGGRHGVRLVRNGRYHLVVAGPVAVEWYPA